MGGAASQVVVGVGHVFLVQSNMQLGTPGSVGRAEIQRFGCVSAASFGTLYSTVLYCT